MTDHTTTTIDHIGDLFQSRCSCGHLEMTRDRDDHLASIAAHEATAASREAEAHVARKPRATTRGQWDPQRRDADSTYWARRGYGDGTI